jgi:hypothetical protein
MLEADEQEAAKKAESAAATRKRLGSLKSVDNSGEPCPSGWRRNFADGCEARGMTIKDQRDPSYFTFDLPGDDKFDVQNHSTGVCTDTNIGYYHTGCDSEAAARGTMAFSGCSGRLFGWATFFCGVLVEVRGPDYVTSIGLAETSLLFPRELVPASQVNGKEQLAITCSDPLECQQRCEYLNTIARDGGLPAPSACALCHPPCPSDGGTVLVDFVHAFFNDLTLLLRLTAICGFTLGLGEACICEIFMLLKPAWMANLDDPVDRCEGGDVFSIIAIQIEAMIIEGAEAMVNTFVIQPIRGLIDWFSNGEPKDICIPYEKGNKFCPNSPELMDGWLGCDVDEKGPAHERCYYQCASAARTASLSPTNAPLSRPGDRRRFACTSRTWPIATSSSSTRTRAVRWRTSSTPSSARSLKMSRQRCSRRSRRPTRRRRRRPRRWAATCR